MREYIKHWLERAMVEPDINSRFIFLFHGVTATICVVILTVAFIVAKNKDGYAIMAGTVGGSGVAAAAGRYLTKKDGGDGKEGS